MSLEDISSATKISVRLLQAIENEDFDRLPGGIFNVNFVRQYARHLGLEEESVVSEYRRLTAPLSPEPQPETTAQRQPIIPPEWTAKKNTEYQWDRPDRSRVWTISIVLMATIVAGGSLWIERRNASRHSRTATVTPPPVAAEKPAQPPAAPSTAPAPETAGAPQAAAPVPAAEAEAPVRVELDASQPVWVSATCDGQVKFEAMLQPQQTRVVTAQNVVRLRVGDAGALVVKLNGQAQPPVGLKGQVRTVILTPKGMQVLTTPPQGEGDEPDQPARARPAAVQNP